MTADPSRHHHSLGTATSNEPPPAGGLPAERIDATPVTVDSRDLFRGAREVLIEHSGETYRLRLTRNGKLILHK